MRELISNPEVWLARELEYSICITHFNNAPTVKQSLESILNQIDDRFEVVVVDNRSTDGSYEILKEFASMGKIKLVQAKSSRGKGREIAFQNSKGKYIVANMDMDDVFKPRLRDLLARYHAIAEGKLLWAYSKAKGGFWGGESFTIAPRNLIEELGGWRDLQIFEDLELCSRAARHGKYCRGEFALLDTTNPHAERTRTRVRRMKWRYLRYREILRIGLPMGLWNKRESRKQKLIKVSMKILILPFYESYVDPFNYEFSLNPSAPIYTVSLEEPTKESQTEKDKAR
jgi:glycosyltransferase involved in cell wall biosynthesis